MTERLGQPGTAANGAVVVIPDVPLGLDVGVDCLSFETGPKFRGIGLIPSGLHFLYHSMGMSGRQGFFFRITSTNDVLIRPWDAYQEVVCSHCNLSEASQTNLLRDLHRGDLNDNLGPYPVAEHHVWSNLSCFIDDNVLLRAQCGVGEVIHGSEATEDFVKLHSQIGSTKKPFSFSSSSSPAVPIAVAEKVSKPVVDVSCSGEEKKSSLEGLGRSAKFVDVLAVEVSLREQMNTLPDTSARAQQLTALYMDKSLILETLVVQEYGGIWENILGELQLSFLMFLLLFCHDALEHWKRLIDMICRSEQFLLSKPDFCMGFMRLVYEQLNFTPTDFFDNELSKNNFLRPALSNLFENLNQLPSSSSSAATTASSSSDHYPICDHNVWTMLHEHRKRLLAFLQKKFGLFMDELDGSDERTGALMDVSNGYLLSDEDAPVVVSAEDMELFGERIEVMMMDSRGRERGDHHMGSVEDVSVPISVSAHVPAPVPAATSLPVVPLTPTEIECGLYSWRYPHLYDAMVGGGLNEDMVMAATRLLDVESSERETMMYETATATTAAATGEEAIKMTSADNVVENEDTGVIAMSIVGESSSLSPSVALLLARKEARMFLEEEVSRRNQVV